ncbi:hypothetical protein [Haloferula sp. BvORR071]|uniref:hypothetical protein n=1 Tax=Haloferula sp. BvORR071 TaxID=1396141 RepID=UPI0005599EF8|nr:hypothetical protein [Haloferula sp. BvORR071]
MKQFLRRHRHRLAFVLIGVMAMAMLAGWYAPEHPLAVVQHWMDFAFNALRGVPLVVFVLAMALLPLVGVPVVPFYLMAGAVYVPLYGLPVTLAAGMAALLLNLLASHAIARRMRPFVERMVARFGITMPQVGKLSAWKLVLLVRVTPGAPLIVQNYLLALAGIPLGLYVIVSLPVEMMICGGYMAAGKSFATGHWGWLLGGLGALAFVLLAAALVREHLAGRKAGE